MQEALGARPGRGIHCFYPQNANCRMPLQLGGCLLCIIIFVYLLAVLGLHFCAQAFSS